VQNGPVETENPTQTYMKLQTLTNLLRKVTRNWPIPDLVHAYTRAESASGAGALIRSPYMMTRGAAAIASSSFASDAHEPNDFLFDIPAQGDLPNGLSDRPYIIHANLVNMERNSEGFQVVYVSGVVHNMKEYNVIEIRHQAMLNDVKLLEAQVWTENIPDEYFKRVIMITGPSLDEFSLDKDKSAAKFPDVACSRSIAARGTQIVAVNTKQNKYRKTNHYLILFEPGTILDNSVFCNDTLIIKKYRKDMAKDHPSNTRTKHTGSFTIWRIEVAEENQESDIGDFD
jgi:hypothetical protein